MYLSHTYTHALTRNTHIHPLSLSLFNTTLSTQKHTTHTHAHCLSFSLLLILCSIKFLVATQHTRGPFIGTRSKNRKENELVLQWNVNKPENVYMYVLLRCVLKFLDPIRNRKEWKRINFITSIPDK